METEDNNQKTERFLLRKIIADDIDNIFRGLSHPDTTKYYGVHFQTLQATEEQMTWFADLEKYGTGQWFAVCSPDNKTFYGAGGLNNVNKEHKKAEIGFWLLPEFWGQGILKEVMPVICDYGFRNFGLHRIEGFVDRTTSIAKKPWLNWIFHTKEPRKTAK